MIKFWELLVLQKHLVLCSFESFNICVSKTLSQNVDNSSSPRFSARGYYNRVRPSVCPLLYLLNRLTDFFNIRYMTSSHDGGAQEQHFVSLRPQGQGGVKRSNIVRYCISSETVDRFLPYSVYDLLTRRHYARVMFRTLKRGDLRWRAIDYAI